MFSGEVNAVHVISAVKPFSLFGKLNAHNFRLFLATASPLSLSKNERGKPLTLCQ